MSKIINFSDEISNLLPLQLNSDTADVNELASLISYTVAMRTADRFKYMAGDMDATSPGMILSIARYP